MRSRVWLWISVTSVSWAHASSPSAHVPDSYRYANQLLPAIVALAERAAMGGAVERKAPQYVAISTGKDEYVYHLKDKIFIRSIKDRYEIPTWRICGDFAVARVELMDDSMKTLPPIMAWHMIYRDDHWQKLAQGDDGQFMREDFTPAELPPYAKRCFESSPDADAR
jgi:hypothetical protein